MTPELSVVLPAYQEGAALKHLLPNLIQSLAELGAPSEIVVVDTLEPLDETEEICRVHGVRHIRRRGGSRYGDAVRTGIREAQGAYIVFMDADGSHNPAQIQRLWDQRQNFDVVIGSRYVEGGQTENPAILIFMSWMVNFSFRLLFGPHSKDMSNSFRLYRASLLKALRLRSHNFDIVEEMLVLLADNRVTEVPVTFERRKAGRSKRNLFLFALCYLWTLMRLYWLKLTH